MVLWEILPRERCLLACRYFFLGMPPHSEPAYYLISPSHRDQVLTGILPYEDGDYDTIARRVGQGERPSRPRNRNQNQWLSYPVWDVIATSWSHKRHQRRGILSLVYRVFLLSSERVQNVKVSESSVQNDKNLTRVGRSQMQKQGHNSVREPSHESPRSSSPCEIRSRKYRGV